MPFFSATTNFAVKGGMLNFDVTDLLERKLIGDNRPPDGYLHPSGDLLGSLRHTQLRAAGAPTVDGDIVSRVRMMTGTQWHTTFEKIFRHKPVMLEVALEKWMPEGWRGIADWVVWNDELNGFVLGDLKTIKGEGIRWILREGIKVEHQWQVSTYWWALYNAGFPMVNGYVVYYLPMNQVIEKGKFANVQPILMKAVPIAEDVLLPVMEERWKATQEYLYVANAPHELPRTPESYLNEHLAPVQERIQKEFRNKAHPGYTDVVLVPHWSASYCPYPDELCDCNTQGNTKIGHWNDGVYVPRKGYEHIEPI